MNVRPPSGARHRRSSGPLRALAGRAWSRPVGAVAVSGALLTAGVTAAHSDPGVPTSWAHEFLVDSLGTEGDDARGDGVCATAAGTCTLRAAIEEANTIDAGAGQVRIGVHLDFAGGLVDITGPADSTWMRTTAVSDGGTITGDNGAVFEITAPVTIDLENRLRAAPPNGSAVPSAAVFHVNGPHITLQGIDDSWGAETTFYVGPQASDVHITGGSMATPNANPKRFLVVRGGATNVRLSDYEVSGFGSNDRDQGWGYVDGSTAADPVRGLVIEGVTYSAGASGACNASSAAGCSSSPMSLRGQTVEDVTFAGNSFVNFARATTGQMRLLDLRSAVVGSLTYERNEHQETRIGGDVPLFDFGMVAEQSAQVGDFVIAENLFARTEGEHGNPRVGVIHLPEGRALGGSGAIVDNDVHGTAQRAFQTSFVYWGGPRGTAQDTTPSGLVIERNNIRTASVSHPSAQAGSLFQLTRTGAVTVRYNTVSLLHWVALGTDGFEIGHTGVLVANEGEAANGKLAPWYPTGNHLTYPQDGCSVSFETTPRLERRSGQPTTVDVYWSSGAGQADVFVESFDVAPNRTHMLEVAMPAPGDPRLAHLPVGANRPINPANGHVGGFLRVQAHYTPAGGQPISTQMSRAMPIESWCRADLTIDQSAEQNDPTLARDLHYTVSSTLALDPETFTPDAVTVTAEPTADTIDAARLNPRAVSVTPVPNTQNKQFTVVARVDDSAVVTAAIEPGRVTAESGVTNVAAATSTDNQITFTNPVVLDPSAVTLVVGTGQDAEYELSTRSGAPVPGADLRFGTALDARGTEFGVTLGSPEPVLPAGADRTGPLTVSVGHPELDDSGDPVRVAHTVASADTNYDGLVVATLDVRLLATNPDLEITKRAFVEVGDTSSPQSVLATGTEAPAGSRLSDGQAVCWVYTVTNTSQDEWASALTDVVVRDTDARLGSDGLIGTLPELGVGATHQLHACAVLIPVDTRPAA